MTAWKLNKKALRKAGLSVLAEQEIVNIVDRSPTDTWKKSQHVRHLDELVKAGVVSLITPGPGWDEMAQVESDFLI